MRALHCAVLLPAACAWADETSDRAAIEKVVIAFNHSDRRAAVLAKDADLDPRARDSGAEPWSEVSQRYFVSHGVRFVTPDVAVVDAGATQYGSLVARRTSAFFVMRREGAAWKIVWLRVAER